MGTELYFFLRGGGCALEGGRGQSGDGVGSDSTRRGEDKHSGAGARRQLVLNTVTVDSQQNEYRDSQTNDK